ncbi:glutamine synthetase/guanido kinase [Phellopilus nigrolimitatus]|nr:glutamine synthetase/guanido kinase [Phellopilus nigrolimitatus]
MSTTSTRPTTLFELENKFDVRFVRLTWVDLANFVRYRVIPIAHFKRLLATSDSQSQGVPPGAWDDDDVDATADPGPLLNPHGGIQLGKIALGLVYLAAADGFPPVGEYVYAPDFASARLLPYAPGHVSVMGWFEEKEAVKGSDGRDTFQAALCPRALLRRVVEDAKKTDDVEFLVGFETEVIFLKSVDPIEAVNEYGWSESAAICAGTPEAKALEEIADALQLAGIELQMYHAEAAPGQFEIVTGPLPPLEACDTLIATREIIMNVAAKHGMRATLAPRVYSNSCGSAAHTHISLKSPKHTSPRARVTGTPGAALTPLEAAFLAGVLAHLPGATAFTLPTAASYARMVDGVWSGGTWVAWGRDNREAPVRLCGRGGADAHFEVKSVDGTACPHLAVAALLAGGMAGVRAGARLEIRGLNGLASELSEGERAEHGVVTRMPLNIEEAREALRTDEVLTKALGEEFVKSYLSVNKTLNEQLQCSDVGEAMIKLVKTF